MGAIELAIDDLNSQEVPHITATAEKYAVDCSTLSCCWRGKSGSKANKAENKGLLNKQQEKTLINKINRLSALDTLSTVLIICIFIFNLTEK